MKQNEAFTFFMGAIVGFVGSIISTSIFEFAKLTLPNGIGWSLFYWGSMFLVSSVFFFQLVKMTLTRLGINENLKSFDYAIVICFTLGIVMMVIGILHVFSILHPNLVFSLTSYN